MAFGLNTFGSPYYGQYYTSVTIETLDARVVGRAQGVGNSLAAPRIKISQSNRVTMKQQGTVT